MKDKFKSRYCSSLTETKILRVFVEGGCYYILPVLPLLSLLPKSSYSDDGLMVNSVISLRLWATNGLLITIEVIGESV